jgi:hypothetical protein
VALGLETTGARSRIEGVDMVVKKVSKDKE